MKLKMNRSVRTGAIGLIWFLCFICAILKNEDILLALNFLLCGLTIINGMISIISLWSFLSNYVILNIAYYYFTGDTYGILGYVSVSFLPMMIYMLVLNATLFTWSFATDFTSREKRLLKYQGFVPGKNFSIVCCLLALASAVIAFPTLPFTQGERFQALLPGNAWNHLAIISLIFVSPVVKKYKFVLGTYALVIFWFLSHYERVDCIGLLIALLVVYLMVRSRKVVGTGKIFKVGIICVLIFAGMTFLGEARAHATFSLTQLLKKFVTQNTACDVGYMYDAAIKYAEKNGFLWGKSYVRYLIELVPVLDASYLETTNILAQSYGFLPGGSFFLNEPLMNFGLVGVITIPNVYILLVYKLMRKRTNYRYIVYVFLLATAFRYLWYGVGFIETGLVWIIPMVYFIYRIMNKEVKI